MVMNSCTHNIKQNTIKTKPKAQTKNRADNLTSNGFGQCAANTVDRNGTYKHFLQYLRMYL